MESSPGKNSLGKEFRVSSRGPTSPIGGTGSNKTHLQSTETDLTKTGMIQDPQIREEQLEAKYIAMQSIVQDKTPSQSAGSSIPEFYPAQAALATQDIATLQHRVGPNGEIIQHNQQRESYNDEESYDDEDSSSGRDQLAFGKTVGSGQIVRATTIAVEKLEPMSSLMKQTTQLPPQDRDTNLEFLKIDNAAQRKKQEEIGVTESAFFGRTRTQPFKRDDVTDSQGTSIQENKPLTSVGNINSSSGGPIYLGAQFSYNSSQQNLNSKNSQKSQQNDEQSNPIIQNIANLQERQSYDSQEKYKKEWGKNSLQSGRSEPLQAEPIQITASKETYGKKIIMWEQQDSENNGGYGGSQGAIQSIPPQNLSNIHIPTGISNYENNHSYEISAKDKAQENNGSYDPGDQRASDQMHSDSFHQLNARPQYFAPLKDELGSDDAAFGNKQANQIQFNQNYFREEGSQPSPEYNNDYYINQFQKDELRSGSQGNQGPSGSSVLGSIRSSQQPVALNQDYDRRSADYDQEFDEQQFNHQSFRVDQQLEKGAQDHKSSIYVQSVDSSIPKSNLIGAIAEDTQEINQQEQTFQRREIAIEANAENIEFGDMSRQNESLERNLDLMAQRSAQLRAPKIQQYRILDQKEEVDEPVRFGDHNPMDQEFQIIHSRAQVRDEIDNALSGTMGANYRNYSVLSKVVKDVSNPSRAIDESLKTMQDAQKTIMLSLNTVETNKVRMLSSGPATAYCDGIANQQRDRLMTVASPGSIKDQNGNHMAQAPSITSIDVVAENYDNAGSLEYGLGSSMPFTRAVAFPASITSQGQTLGESTLGRPANPALLPQEIHLLAEKEARSRSREASGNRLIAQSRALRSGSSNRLQDSAQEFGTHQKWVRDGQNSVEMRVSGIEADNQQLYRRGRSPIASLRSPNASAMVNQSMIGYSEQAYSKSPSKRLQDSGLALLKKTGALVKNPPAVSSYKPHYDQNAKRQVKGETEGITTSQHENSLILSEPMRPKSQHRRYVIGKLFKKATGLELKDFKNDYNQAKEYRENISEMRIRKSRGPQSPLSGGLTSKGSQKGSGRAYSQHAGHPLRLKSREAHEASSQPSRVNPQILENQAENQQNATGSKEQGYVNSSQAMLAQNFRKSRLRSTSGQPGQGNGLHQGAKNEPAKHPDRSPRAQSPERAEQAQTQPDLTDQSPVVAQRRAFLSRATKLTRYKQIERELEDQRQSQKELEWIQEREAWQQKQDRLAELEEQTKIFEQQQRSRPARNLVDRDSFERQQSEKQPKIQSQRLAAEQEVRLQNMAQQTINQDREFEQQHWDQSRSRPIDVGQGITADSHLKGKESQQREEQESYFRRQTEGSLAKDYQSWRQHASNVDRLIGGNVSKHHYSQDPAIGEVVGFQPINPQGNYYPQHYAAHSRGAPHEVPHIGPVMSLRKGGDAAVGHQNSDFTLGAGAGCNSDGSPLDAQSPQIGSVEQLVTHEQWRQITGGTEGIDPRMQVPPGPQLQGPYFALPGYGRALDASSSHRSGPSLIQLQEIQSAEIVHNIPQHGPGLHHGAYGAPEPPVFQHQNRPGFPMIHHDSFLGLHGGNADSEMPSRIHREASGRGSNSRSPLRSRGSSQSNPSPIQHRLAGAVQRPPVHVVPEQVDYLSRNKQLRAQYESLEQEGRRQGFKERSKSRPDMLPCRGPSDRPPQLREQAPSLPQRVASPSVLTGIGLKSSFGKRQASEGQAAPADRARSYEPQVAREGTSQITQADSSKAPRPAGVRDSVYQVQSYYESSAPDKQKLLVAEYRNTLDQLSGILPSKRAKSAGNGRAKREKKLKEESKRELLKETQAEVLAAIQKVNESISLLPQAPFHLHKRNQGAREFMNVESAGTAENGALQKTYTGGLEQHRQTAHQNSRPLAQPNMRVGNQQETGLYVELPKQHKAENQHQAIRGPHYIQLHKNQYIHASHAGSLSGQQMNHQVTQSQTTIAQSNLQNSQPSSRLSRSRKILGSNPPEESKLGDQIWHERKSNEERADDSRCKGGIIYVKDGEKTKISSLNTKNLNQESNNSFTKKNASKERVIQKNQIEKIQGQKKQRPQKRDELAKLMDLQVRQAQMLMDLQQQYNWGQDSFRQSDGPQAFHDSQQLAVEDLSSRNHKRHGADHSQQSSKTNLSATQRSTVGLIQAIYRQMEKINTQLSRKEQIEQEKFAQMEKKMNKLQKKYSKIKEQYQVEQSHSQRTQLLSKSQAQSSASVAPGFEQIRSQQFEGMTESRPRTEKFNDFDISNEISCQNTHDLQSALQLEGQKSIYESNKSKASGTQTHDQVSQLKTSSNQNPKQREAASIHQSILKQHETAVPCQSQNRIEPDIQIIQKSKSTTGQKIAFMPTNQSYLNQLENNNNDNCIGPQHRQQKVSDKFCINEEQEQRLLSEGPMSQTTTDEPTALEALNAPNPFLSDQSKVGGLVKQSDQIQNQPNTIQSITHGSQGSSRDDIQPGATPTLGGRAIESSNYKNSIDLQENQNRKMPQEVEITEQVEKTNIISEETEDQDQPGSTPTLSKQLQIMNDAVAQLRVDQQAQLTQMKEFYENQMNLLREEYVCKQKTQIEKQQSPQIEQNSDQINQSTKTVQKPSQVQIQALSSEDVAAQVLKQLMGSDQFQDTIGQLTQAVDQKEKLEQRLKRIKDKLHRAKNIRSDPSFSEPPSGVGTEGQTTPLEATLGRQEAGELAFLSKQAEDRSHATAFTSLPGPEAAASLKNLSPPDPSSTQRPVKGEAPPQHSSSVQPSSVTLSHQASHKLLEGPNPHNQSRVGALDSQTAALGIAGLGSDEDFAKGLNYQYVSRDLRPRQNEPGQGLQGSRSQYISEGQAAVADSRFHHAYRPTQSAYQPTNPRSVASDLEGPNSRAISDIYLRDTSHSMLQIEVNRESRREILQDGKRGVYQKIVDLQQQQQRRDMTGGSSERNLGQQASGSTTKNQKLLESGASHGDAQSTNRDYSKPFYPSKDSHSQNKSARGHQQVLNHIANLECIQQNYLTGAPAPLQNQFADNAGTSEIIEGAFRSNEDHKTPSVAKYVGLSSKFAHSRPLNEHALQRPGLGEEIARDFEMQSEQSILASAASERSKHCNFLQETSFNKADIFASSVSNTFAEKRDHAFGDQPNANRGFAAAGRDFETKEFSAAFQSNEDPHNQRSLNDLLYKQHEWAITGTREQSWIDCNFRKVMNQDMCQIEAVSEEGMSKDSSPNHPKSQYGETTNSLQNETQELKLNNHDDVQ